MKKKLLLTFSAVLLGLSLLMAQGGNYQRRTPEERTKLVMEKLVDLKLEKINSDKVDTVIRQFYIAQEKMMNEMRANGGMQDREGMMAARRKLAEERDGQLKAIFTEAQMKKWKEEIEPSLRPQRGGGGQ